MSLIVRELIVRAVVEPESGGAQTSAPSRRRRAEDERALVERCANEVFRILRDKEER